MEYIFYLLFIGWLSFVTHFLFIFFKSDMDFNLTIDNYKNLKNKLLKKNNLKEVEFKKEEVKEITKEDIENNLKELEKIEINKKKPLDINLEKNLVNPEGFPIDLTLRNDLSEEEKLVRDRVLKKIKTEPSFFYEGGRKKMVLPLEAILFLNRGYNPLVNENGEIIISIKEHKIMEELKEIIMSLKSNGEIIYKSDEEIISSMKVLIDLSRQFEKPIEEIGKMFLNKLNEKIINENTDTVINSVVSEEKNIVSEDKKNFSENVTTNKNTKIILEEPEISEEELLSLTVNKKPQNNLKEENSFVEKEIISKNKKEDLNETGLTEEELNEMLNPSKNNSNENTVLVSPEDLLLAEMNSLKIESKKEEIVVDSNDKNIKVFLQNIKWSSGTNVSMDWKNIEACIQNILGDSDNYTSFLRNIIKQQPLVFNDSKTVVFVEIHIIYVAFAKLFGVDYDTIIGKLKKMPARIFNEYKEGVAKSFGDHVSDLITGEKNMSVNYFYEGNTFYRGTGIWLTLDIFKICLKDEEFDFFRSYPYNDKIKLGTKNNNSIPLINDIESTEI